MLCVPGAVDVHEVALSVLVLADNSDVVMLQESTEPLDLHLVVGRNLQ